MKKTGSLTQKEPMAVDPVTANGSMKLTIPWEPKPEHSTGPLWRFSGNPVIGRHHLPGVQGVYNSAVVPFHDQFAGVFRLERRTRFPLLHRGFSPDGIRWDILPEPVRFYNATHDPADYAYDPRVGWIEDAYYITWCCGHQGPSIGMARTMDFERFERLENAFLPFNRNGVMFPRRIRGKYYMLSRPSDNGHTPFGDIFVSESPDLCYWGKHRLVMRRGGDATGQWWQRTKIGAGPIPIELPDGWLLIYHGVMDTCNGFVYSLGTAILDLEEPWRVRYRVDQHLLTPEADYEVSGHVPNVVFPCAALHDYSLDRLAIYYGAADTFSCLAFGQLSEVVEFTKQNSKVF
jgi:beta-1,4-mannooligosaccharide/beta-1,4-mannosyl-N-acetylglucosamine phosphorylase